MKRQFSSGDDLCASGFLPSTRTVRAVFADGSTQRFMFDTNLPVVGVEDAGVLPFFPKNRQTSGPYEYYEERTQVVLNEGRFMNAAGKRVPPLAARRKENRMEQWKQYTPVEGDVIGFVGGKELKYLGKATPVSRSKSTTIHVLGVGGIKYVAVTRIASILCDCGPGGGKMTQKTFPTLKAMLTKANNAITIESRPGDVFDTLMMLKLIGAVSAFSPRQSFVSVKEVDDVLLACGFGDVMDWNVRTGSVVEN